MQEGLVARRDDLDIPLPGVMPATGPSYRVPRRKSGLEGNSRRMLMIAGGLSLGIVGIVAAASYNASPRRTGIPVVEADARPIRERPTKAGGLEVEGADAAGPGNVPDTHAALGPPPEAPAIAGLKHQAATAAAAAAAAATPKPQPVSLTAAPPAPIAQPHGPAHALPPGPAVATAQPAAKPSPVPPAATQPAATPAPKPAPAHGTIATPTLGRAQVQLAAVGSEQDAMSEWKRLEKRMPDLLTGRQPAVQKVEREGRTLWRLRTGTFTDAADATQFCEKIRAKGSGCTVASF